MNNINICLACDDNYAPLCGVAMASVLKNSNDDEFISFYILDNNIKQSSKDKINKLKKIRECNINFIDIKSKEKFENLYLPEKKGYLSIVSYYRFLMPDLFPELDKILYIDCDVIATSSLAPFYNTDITSYYAAMIKDTSNEENKKRLNFLENEVYCNSGVLLANLKKWREDQIQQKLFDQLGDGLDDQDIINIVLKNNIFLMDETWNYQGKAKDYKEKNPPKLIHFITAYKPWRTGSKQSFNKEYFKALKGTPWDSFYSQYLKQYMPNIHKDRLYLHFCLWGLKTRIKIK